MRMFKLAAAALAMAAPVAAPAATFILNGGSFQSVPADNDFQANLGALSLNGYVSGGATLGFALGAGETSGIIDLFYMGSESGLVNTFNATGNVGAVSYAETNKAVFSPLYIGSVTFTSTIASLGNAFNFLGGTPGAIGSNEFGIFVNRAKISGNFDTLYFGYDDNGANPEDNHDDFIVRAVIRAVPEPGTWAMMISGFLLVGSLLRQRKSNGIPVLA